eukprot:CAMPEP_0181300022 /NCGR_PEP_ID=MMETSP1101-20121128/6663_1 /TAXON_ID=46948 /ORGANISM="Rhodomonas abbreviata, Strain Caron Lab Isolate" /LENGTH=208 /DNA_ID=CAMNT_0023405221 /DNA_START=63 /DNA_END=689 /DNA_ORIENTATION=+
MAAFLAAAPQGFMHAVQVLEDLSPAELEELALQVMKTLLQRTGHLSHKELACKLSRSKEQREVLPFDPSALRRANQAVNALSFLLRDAVRLSLSGQDLTLLLQTSAGLSPPPAAVIGRAYHAHSPLLLSSDKVKAMLSVGRLVNFDWKVSLCTETSQAERLNAPIITLRFQVALPNGQVSSHSAELSLKEFEEFADKVGEMSAVLETL